MQPAQSIVPIKPTDLRGILNYVPRFKDQTFVIAVDGSIVADDNFSNILLDIAVLRSLSIRVVLVHGIGQQLRELSKKRKVPVSDTQGAGVTDAATLDLAIKAASHVSHQILEGLTQTGLKCAVTNAIRAVPVGVVKGVDHLYSGRVDRVDKDFLVQLISAQVIPVLPPVGFDRDGRTLRINSDSLAAEVAAALGATKVIFLSPMPGLEINGTLRRDIAFEELNAVMGSRPEAVPEAARSKALQAVRAVQAGTPRVHLIDGTVFDGLLNEVFSNEGVGTLVYGNDYQQIRRARKGDVRLIHNLTRNAVRREELLYRTQQAIEKNIDDFFVLEIDENIIACAALHCFPDAPGVAEIGALYVMPFFQDRGIGKKMVDYACMEARKRGAGRVLALSTQSFQFFTSVCGFSEAGRDALPESRLKSYEESGRNSKILVKKLE